jgi:NhaP-type Na+/H+ or K+/H+ antiporter
LCVGTGYLLVTLLGGHHVERSRGYFLVIGGLLAIGLYGATAAIPRDALRDWRTIVVVVTVGVVLKAGLIGGTLWLVFGDPIFFPLGVVVAQIDPLSVAALMDNSPMSDRAKAILASWSSFDDPVTVILSVSLMTAAAPTFSDTGAGDSLRGSAGFLSLGTSLLWNAALAGAAWLAFRLARRRSPVRRDVAVISTLVVTAAVAVWRFLMLGVATSGLFLRPRLAVWGKVVARTVRGAFLAAAAMLGVLLHHGISLGAGVALGVAAFFAQVLVGFALTARLPRADRIYLAISQQNGMTSIVLALTLAPSVSRAVGIVGPAILTINLLHYGFNLLARRRPHLLGLRPPRRAPAEPATKPATGSAKPVGAPTGADAGRWIPGQHGGDGDGPAVRHADCPTRRGPTDPSVRRSAVARRTPAVGRESPP